MDGARLSVTDHKQRERKRVRGRKFEGEGRRRRGVKETKAR